MVAIACCKHALARVTAPVCLECYNELSNQYQYALEALRSVQKDILAKKYHPHKAVAWIFEDLLA